MAILLLLLFFLSLPLLIFLLKTLTKTQQNTTTINLPPGPRKLPIIGNLHQVGSKPHVSFHNLSLTHGPLFHLTLGSIPTLVVSSSDILHEIFKSHDLAFSGRPSLYAARKLSYGSLDMAFAPYGEHWRQLRKLCMLEVLSLKRVQSFRPVREKEVKLLVRSIQETDGCEVNLSETTLGLGNDLMCAVLFGERFKGRGFSGAARETEVLLGGFCVADFWPALEWVERFSGLKRRVEKNFEELDGFYDEVIEEHLKRGELRGEHMHDEDLVDVLLRLHKDKDGEHGSVFSTMNHIKGLLTDLFVAGTDTSSATIVWTMTELMRNPKVMNKVRQELQIIIGDKPIVQEVDLQQLHYLKLVIKESLRMHPAVPLLVPRETIEACNIRGYNIPAGMRVFVNAKAIAMDPKSWENPTEFNPDRFLSCDVDFRGQHSELTPFGFGRRSCPGINFAVVLVELALANLLHCFDWELPAGMKMYDLDVEEAFGLTTHKKNPLILVAKAKL